MKRNLTLGIFAGILLILVLALPSKKEKPEKEKNRKEQIIRVPAPELKSMTLYSGSNAVTAEKTENGFLILPGKFEGGKTEVFEALSRINSLEGFPLKQKAEGEGKTLAELEKINGEKVTLKITGEREFGAPAYYISSPRGLFVVGKKAVDALLKTQVDDLRDHTLTSFSSEEVAGFKLDRKEFYQKEKGKWFIRGLEEDKTDAHKVFTAFSAVSGMRIKSFTDSKNFYRYGLNHPQHVLEVDFKEKEDKTFYFSQKNGKYYAAERRERKVYEIHEQDWKILAKDLKEYQKEKKNLKEPESAKS